MNEIHGYSARKAVELGLTNDDLLVLRWFEYSVSKEKLEPVGQGKNLYLVDYAEFLNEMEIIKVTKDWLSRKHFKKLAELGVLTHEHLKKIGRKKGSFSCYGFGARFAELKNL